MCLPKIYNLSHQTTFSDRVYNNNHNNVKCILKNKINNFMKTAILQLKPILTEFPGKSV